jgi:chaperonin GroES
VLKTFLLREGVESARAGPHISVSRFYIFEGETTMATKVRPLHDRVIVRRLDEEEKSSGGIIIPDSAKEKPVQGKVIAVGKGKSLENGEVRPLDVKAGDTVIFSTYAGTEIKLDDEALLMMREDDILGVIE